MIETEIVPAEPDEGDQPMFDQLRQRLRVVIETSVTRPDEAVARHLENTFHVKEQSRGGSVMRLIVHAPVRDGLLAEAKVQLWLDRLLGGLSVRAEVQMNGHDILRHRYGIEGSVKGAAGATNFALPSVQYEPDDLQLQLDAFAAVDIAIRDAILAPLPDGTVREARVKIVAGELCLDLACDDPQDALRKDRLAPQPGTRTVTHTVFATSTESGRKLCNKERVRTHGPLLIAYEKWVGHVRVESKAPTAAAVNDVLGPDIQNDAPLTLEGVFQLLLAFYISAGEACCERKDHFVRASRSQRTILDLIIALMPLLRVAMREPADGGYRPREDAASIAKRVLCDLLTSGITHAVGVLKGTRVRQILEDLAAPGGPLTRKDRSTIFCLSAEYAYAVSTSPQQISKEMLIAEA